MCADLTELLVGDVLAVAPRLLGCRISTMFEGVPTELVIGEVEAYGGSDDPASHAFRGRSPRNASMFEVAGTLYVYRAYGIHWCANVVTGADGDGQAVLIRAIEPLDGVDEMLRRRGRHPIADGPGKLCQALGIDGADDGLDLVSPGSTVRIVDDGTPPPTDPLVGPRVGISKAVDTPWRWRAMAGPR